MRPSGSLDPLWYKDAVIYELPVKSFCDANGDGVGDFAGLSSQLDYLQTLGVTCLWLLPFFPSPLRDDGYDIADYVNVHPSCGTLDDFKAFLDGAHGRGLRVVIELVMNHTSDQHPWFQRARRAPAGSPERDYYVWSDTEQRYRDARIIFTDSERSNWTWDPVAEAYYWHRFFHHQPDLNYDNPAVVARDAGRARLLARSRRRRLPPRRRAVPGRARRNELRESARDPRHHQGRPRAHRRQGAGLDAARRSQPAACRRVRVFRARRRVPHGVSLPGDAADLHGPASGGRRPIAEVMEHTPAIPETCQWALFLRNHDELTLEMVTDDERDYMYLAYSMDPQARLNVGIRRRLAPLVGNSRRRIELLNGLLFSFPGTPIIYYGDEIGMGDNLFLGDRNGVRTPMQWTGDRNAGFSRCDPARLYSPVIMDAVYGYQAVNVEAQESDGASLLHWMRNMIRLRKLFKVFGQGTIEFLTPANRSILAYVRRYRGDVILCVANLSRSVQPVELDLSAFAGLTPVEMLGYTEFPAIGAVRIFCSLGPYAFYWFELQRSGRPPTRPRPPTSSSR